MSAKTGTAEQGGSDSGPSQKEQEPASEKRNGEEKPGGQANGQEKASDQKKHNEEPETGKSEPNGADEPQTDTRLSSEAPPDEPGHPKQGASMKAVAHARASDLKDQVNNRKEKLMSKTKPPGGFDETPIPEAPRGYTVKFTFVKCTNMPPSDLRTASADPYLVATLTSNLPRRHREDPALQHRTRTVYKKTEPEWREDWVVANVPQSGFTLKCRIYDEDWPDHNDRLGNVTFDVPRVDEKWEGFPGPEGKEFPVKKRVGSKTAYLVKGIASALSTNIHMTPHLYIAAEVLGKSDPPYGQMYTLGPSRWVQHFSPMFGRITGTKVNKDADQDAQSNGNQDEKKTQKHEWVHPEHLS